MIHAVVINCRLGIRGGRKYWTLEQNTEYRKWSQWLSVSGFFKFWNMIFAWQNDKAHFFWSLERKFFKNWQRNFWQKYWNWNTNLLNTDYQSFQIFTEILILKFGWKNTEILNTERNFLYLCFANWIRDSLGHSWSVAIFFCPQFFLTY